MRKGKKSLLSKILREKLLFTIFFEDQKIPLLTELFQVSVLTQDAKFHELPILINGSQVIYESNYITTFPGFNQIFLFRIHFSS